MKRQKNSIFHILFMIDEIVVKGGSERHLYDLATGMLRRGHQVSVFSLTDGEYAREFNSINGLHYYCLNVKRIYGLSGMLALSKLARFLRKNDVDIIQTFHTASDLTGPVAAWLSGRKVKVYSSRRDLGFTKSPRHIMVQKRFNHFISGILANSNAVKCSIHAQEAYPLECITVIYNGIDVRPFEYQPGERSRIRRELGVHGDSVIIGSIGNIRPVKGYDFLVESAAKICELYPNVLFVHIGCGEMLNILQGRCKALGIESRFKFLGNRADIPAFLSAFDIYIQPSLSEGFSNAILEAMAAKLPVIVTDVGGNPEVVIDGETGYLIPPKDESAIIDAIIKTIKLHDISKQLAERGQALIYNKFNIETMLDNYELFYINNLQL